MNAGRNYQMHGGIAGAAVAVRVKPSSRADRVTRILDDGTVEICLCAAGSNPKAVNSALVKYLAEISGVRPSNIEIVAGEGGNKKLVTFTNVGKEKVNQSLVDQLSA
jgi:uncharacterized protein YggU (UPF0235/DUF167 family)